MLLTSRAVNYTLMQSSQGFHHSYCLDGISDTILVLCFGTQFFISIFTILLPCQRDYIQNYYCTDYGLQFWDRIYWTFHSYYFRITIWVVHFCKLENYKWIAFYSEANDIILLGVFPQYNRL